MTTPDYGSFAGNLPLSDHACTKVRGCMTRPGDALTTDARGNLTLDRTKLVARCATFTDVQLRAAAVRGTPANPVTVSVANGAQLPDPKPVLEASDELGATWTRLPLDGTPITVAHLAGSCTTMRPRVQVREVATRSNTVKFSVPVTTECLSAQPAEAVLRVCAQPNLLRDTPDGLAVTGTIATGPISGNTGTAGFGVFTSLGRWQPSNGVWDSQSVTRIPLQTTVDAQGLTLTGGKIVPTEKGRIWEVTTTLTIAATRALRVWASLEGLAPTMLDGTVRNHSGCINLTAAHQDPYPATLIINATGPTEALDSAGAGFGTLQVTTDSPGNCTVRAVRTTVKQLGTRTGGRR